MPTAKIRVRFAPSPTGDVHIGSIWLAQFDWLFAKQHGGAFVLRIEDTDRQRLVPGSVEKIYETLSWYGLTPDEGPNEGGPFGPYVQSERLDLYRPYAEQLVRDGHAYHCFCTPERLDQLRQEQTASKQPPRYDKRCLQLPADEVRQRIAAGERHVIRLNVPTSGTVILDDVVRGRVTFRYDQVDDSVLIKSDNFPTYHLAVVVDDHLMGISHVLRAEEWLPSTPKHLLLYQAFGWTPPIFAHLPQILGTNKKKLSKRDGAAAALHFRDRGYLVEAMQNFLALMGWHPKGDDEVLTRDQLIEQFRLEAMNPSGAIFDLTKLDWLNGHYLRQLPLPVLRTRAASFWTPPRGSPGTDFELRALGLIHDRIKVLSDIPSLIDFLFASTWDAERPNFDTSMLVPKQGSMEGTRHHLGQTLAWLRDYDGPWTAAELKRSVMAAIAAAGKKNGEILWPLRVALTLRTASPDVFDVLGLLGKEESLRRIADVMKS